MIFGTTTLSHWDRNYVPNDNNFVPNQRTALHVQVFDVERVFLDEFAAGFDGVAHEDTEHFIGGSGVVHCDFQERASLDVHGRGPQLFGVHFAEALEAGDLLALLTELAEGLDQLADAGELDAAGGVVDVERIVRLAVAVAGGEQVFHCEVERFQFFQRLVDGADFVEVDDLQDAVFDGFQIVLAIGVGGRLGGQVGNLPHGGFGGGDCELFAAAEFFGGEELVEIFFDEEPMLVFADEDSEAGQAAIGREVVRGNVTQVDAATLHRFERVSQATDQRDQLVQAFGFDAGAVFQDDDAFVEANLDQLAHHLFVRLDVADFAALLDFEERWLSDVDTAVLDQFAEVTEDERQQQRADVAAVDVGIGHQDQLAVAPLLDVFELSTGRDSDRFEDVADLDVVENLGEDRFLDVQDFAAQRQDRLRVGVAAGVGGAAGRIAFDEVQFAEVEVSAAAIAELVGQAAGGESALLVADEIAGFARGFASFGGDHAFHQDGLGGLRILFEEAAESVADHRRDGSFDFAVAEFDLGLRLELWIGVQDGDDGGEALTEVIAGRREVFEKVVLLAVVVERASQAALESAEVRAAVWVVDVVGEAADDVRRAVVVLQGDLDADDLFDAVGRKMFVIPFDVNHFRVQWVGGAVEELDVFQQTILVAKLVGLIGPLIEDANHDARVEERHLAQPIVKHVVSELGLWKDLRIGRERDLRARRVAFANLL